MEPKEEESAWTPPSPEELSGEFPRLEISSLLALGGMSAVYLVRQESLDRLAVLKVLPLETGADPDASSRFQTEARALASVRDPHVVEVYDFGRTPGGWLYLLLEYEGGGDLRRWVRERPAAVTSDEALRVGLSVAAGLAAAHRRGIVHGDIKPDNIFLDDSGRIKVGDFGLAGVSGVSTATHHTPGYTAPEILAGDRLATPRSDLYAAGATLFELLLGTPPPEEEAARAGALEKLPQPVAEVIGWPLLEDPARRPAAAEDWQKALETALARLVELSARRPGPVPPVVRRMTVAPGAGRGRTGPAARPPKSSGLMIATVAAVAMAGGAAYMISKSGGNPSAAVPAPIPAPGGQSTPLAASATLTKTPGAEGSAVPDPFGTGTGTGTGVSSGPDARADGSPPATAATTGNAASGNITPASVHPPDSSGPAGTASGIQKVIADLNGPDDQSRNPDEAWLEEGTEKVAGAGGADGVSSTPVDERGKFTLPLATDAELSEWGRDWTIDAPRDSRDDGARFSGKGTDNGGKVLVLAPWSPAKPAVLSRRMPLPGNRPMQLSVRVRSKPFPTADWILKAFVNGQPLSPPVEIATHNDEKQFEQLVWDLSAWKGQEVSLRLESHAGGTNPWLWEHSYWSWLKVEPLSDILAHARFNAAEASKGPVEPGFVDLFSPAQAPSWKGTETGGLSFNGGVATVYTRPGADRKGLIRFPKRMFRDFVLKTEFKMDTPRADSGIWLRVPDPWGKQEKEEKKAGGGPVELEIRGDSLSRNGTGSLAGQSAPTSLPLKENDWNCYELTVIGTRHAVKLNNVLINTWEGGSAEPGHLALQYVRSDSHVHYRNMWIKELAPGSAAAAAAMAATGPQPVIAKAVNADAAPTTGGKVRPLRVPADAQEFNGRWYRYYPGKMLWRMAKKRCEDLRGRLAKVPDAATNAFLTELAGGACAWLGATDEKAEGDWYWLDGTPVAYNSWGPGQPDNTRDREDFLGLWKKGKWNDVGNDDTDVQGYICEWN